MSDLISYQLEDGIATLTLNNGKVNAISPDVIAAFNAALDQAVQDRAVVMWPLTSTTVSWSGKPWMQQWSCTLEPSSSTMRPKSPRRLAQGPT